MPSRPPPMATKVPQQQQQQQQQQHHQGFPADRSFDSSQCSLMASPRGHYPLRCHNGGSAVPLHNSVVCLNPAGRGPSHGAPAPAAPAAAASASTQAGSGATPGSAGATCASGCSEQQGPLSGDSLCLWIAIGATVGNIIVVVVVYVCTFYEV